MANTVQIIVNAKDNASGVLGGVKNALGGLGKIALGGLAVGLGGAIIATTGLTAALSDCTKGAMEAQGIQAQLEQVIKSTGGAAGVSAEMANDLATSLQDVTRFEDDAIVSGENMLLTFTNIGKDVFPAATETMLDMSQALGQDMQASAVQLGKALNDPIAGISALSRVGVTFTDSQKEMIESMVKAGDTAGAQKLILQELQREFGGSARAAGETFAGKLDILQNKLGGIKDTIGTALLPVLTELADKFIAGLNTPEFQAALDSAVKFITDTAIPGLTKLADWFVNTGIPKAQEFVKLFNEQGLQGVVTALSDWANSPETQAQVKGAGLAVANALIAGIVDTANWAGPKFAGASKDIAAWMEDPATKATMREAGRNLGIGIVDGIKSVFTPGSGEMAGGALGMLLGIRQMGYQIITDIRMLGVEMAAGLVGGLIGAVLGPEWGDRATAAFRESFRKMTQVLTLDLEGLGRELVESIAKGIASSDAIRRAAVEAAQKALQGARDALGIHSPSKVFMEIGTQMMAGMAAGIGQSVQPQMALAAATPVLAGTPTMGGGMGAGAIITINLTYAPVVSLADEYEAATRLKPFIAEGVKQALMGA